jgi:hypothetical protein
MSMLEQFFFHLQMRRARRRPNGSPVVWVTPWIGEPAGVHRQFLIASSREDGRQVSQIISVMAPNMMRAAR